MVSHGSDCRIAGDDLLLGGDEAVVIGGGIVLCVSCAAGSDLDLGDAGVVGPEVGDIELAPQGL